VALYTREKPVSVQTGFGRKEYDNEGRILIADYGSFALYNIYFPNGKASEERLAYKMAFYDAFLDNADKQKKAGKSVIVCGDVNTAHREIDLSRPKENEKVSGFLPEERAWIDRFISHGYIDTFRMFQKEGGHYSWWDLKSGARERNVGWRIDYFFASEDLQSRIELAFILPEVTGSDHCPIGIQIRLDDTK
jgi:exodeoxyribonuclease-3